MAEGRTGFSSVVLAGLATAALTAVSAGKPWFAAAIDHKLLPGVRDPDRTADMPIALALSLVMLAGWGALLATRGRARRVTAAIALLAALGIAVSVVVAPLTLPDQIRENLLPGSDDVSVSPTGWYLTCAIATALSVGVLGLAWLRAPQWPTMSTRYDAPATRATGDQDTDLWKALDAGHDPTDPNRSSRPPSP